MLAVILAVPAHAKLDIEDKGPVLSAGGFALRITNAGIIGNPFVDKGLSYDPSFEIRPGSGAEALHHAELWVGAQDDLGSLRVSGGPMLEWRPTLDPADTVRVLESRPGVRRQIDDDGDGEIDEEQLDGLDNDGDGEIDEDLALFAQQMMSAEYVDDRPEAVFTVYENGETHTPLGLSVHQEAYAWSADGYQGTAGLSFKITNHGRQVLRNVRVGLLADLDARGRNDRSGHLNDRISTASYARRIFVGTDSITMGGANVCGLPLPCPPLMCFTNLGGTVTVLSDRDPRSGLPYTAVVPLRHTVDPLAQIAPAAHLARAPATVSFRTSIFTRGRIPGQGGLPSTDRERYQALASTFPTAATTVPDDYVVLVSCGPFVSLGPGQSIDFDVALVSTLDPDSLETLLGNAAVLHHGRFLNLLPDSSHRPYPKDWNHGETGINGHEVCIEPPSGATFEHDPDCPEKLDPEARGFPQIYRHGECRWTDADCQGCTGLFGLETHQYWGNPRDLPNAPGIRIVPGDHQVRIEWDNRPEVLHRAGLAGAPSSRFLGYRVYKLADWRRRSSLLPPSENWALLGSFSNDLRNSEIPIATITDTTLDYERILYEQKLYPVGRYAVVDSEVLNGFDYGYAVVSVLEQDLFLGPSFIRTDRFESPFTPRFDRIVRPDAAARDRAGSVWVVPNPFRAREVWQRPVVLGDPITRHIDFMGLPRARSTIKIWTVAGDFVVSLEHDGTGGDGEAAWNLVSRNGQEVESGIYLFTVESTLGQQTGKFVVIR